MKADGMATTRTCLATAGVVLLGFLAGCRDRDCKTEIPEGATYRVKVLEETQDSNACHVVPLAIGSEFQLTAGPITKTSPDDCTMRRAEAPPPVDGIELSRCWEFTGGSLGIACTLEYADVACTGRVSFYLTEIREEDLVSYDAQEAFYEVGDFPSADCPPATTRPAPRGCIDRYRVNVRRIHP